MEHSRRLAGLVHAAGSRAERLERVQSAIERQFEEAETTLRLVREELTQPSTRPAASAPEPDAGAEGSAGQQPAAIAVGASAAAGAGKARPLAWRNSRRARVVGRHALLFAAGCLCTGAVLSVVDPDTGAWRTVAEAVPPPAGEVPAKLKTAAVTRSSQSARPPGPESRATAKVLQAQAPQSQIAMAQGASGGERAATQPPERTVPAAAAPPVADPSPGVIVFAPSAHDQPWRERGPQRGAKPPYSQRFAGVNSAERQCLARAVYYEAGGEPITAQIAVAQVALNRALAEDGPRTICGVVDGVGGSGAAACQASAACGKGPPRTGGQAWSQAQKVGEDLLSGETWLAELLPATHFHRHDQPPPWRHAMAEIGRIGGLVFYRPLDGAATARSGPGGARQVPSAATAPARR